MKFALVIATFALAAGAAQAAPLTCNTNVNADPRQGNTRITINAVSEDRVSVTQVTDGGMAHFVTAPLNFDATIERSGPELVKYSNATEGFELTVSFQPIGGKIRGTVTTDIMGRSVTAPVVCVSAFN